MKSIPADTQGFTRNLAIMASAGTGKTYQLAMRYILLLLKGAKPEDIVAVTFTKKAAGEIFEKIMTQLLELILFHRKLRKAVLDGFLPENVCRQDLISVLQKILTCRKKLHIETNDSFLMQSVQSSPARFGIMGEISMLDEEDDRPRKRALLQALHSPAFSSGSEESLRKRQDIYMVLRDSAMGNEKSNLCSEVAELLKRFYNLYLEHPCREDWVLPLMPSRRNDLLPRAELSRFLQECERLLQLPIHEEICRSSGVFEKFVKLMECASSTAKENVVRIREKDLKTVSGFFLGKNAKLNVLADPPEEGGAVSFTFSRRTYTVNAELFSCVRVLMFHIAASEYQLLQRKTTSVYDLMAFFDESYAMQTRRQGLLTFQDILYLINAKEQSDYGILQMLRERLALNIDHYLLDEFQDTSDTQWAALRDLVSDVIQWNEESRFTSFFMVADVKQSLYQWRKGNPEIFWRICSDYCILPEEKIRETLSGGGICNGVLKGLNCSYRSAAAVLQMVNEIFDPAGEVHFPARLSAHTLPFCRQRTAMNFLKHVSGLKDEDPSRSCAMFLEVSASSDPEEACIRSICEMIRKIDPFSPARKKKLSVAVLARKNVLLRNFYEQAAVYMPELNVSMEGKLFLAESMGYAVFRQLLIYSMHPGDRCAEGFFALLRTPSGEPCTEEEIFRRLYPETEKTVSLRSRIRAEVEQSSYTGFFRHFRRAFPEVEGEREYMDILEESLDHLEKEAQIPAVDELLLQLDASSGSLGSMADTVQLMTVHKSKGLGFDVVFYLDIISSEQPGNFFDSSGSGSLYFMPPKALREYSVPVMEDGEKQEEKELYEFLCNLYVALTRAKCAQYFIGMAEKENSTAQTLHFSDVLRATLSGKGNPLPGEKESFFAGEIGKALAAHMSDESSVAIHCSYCTGDPLWYEICPSGEGKTLPHEDEEDFLVKAVNGAVNREKEFLQEVRARDVAVCKVLPGTVLHRSAPPSRHIPERSMRFLSMKGAETGTEIHRILSGVQWLSSPESVQHFLDQYREEPDHYKILSSMFEKKELCDLFRETPPEGGYTHLLVEQPFLTQDESGALINGIMDRAVIYYDKNGNAVSGEVIDFKTDSPEDPEELKARYSGQLEAYRNALSLWSSLPAEKISCVILAVRSGSVIRF